MSRWSMRQLAGQTKAVLVWVKAKSLKVWLPTPTSPRRYQPLNSCTGACTTGGKGWGIGPRSAANAPGIMTNAAAPASINFFTLPMASSFLQQGAPGDGPKTDTNGVDDAGKSLNAT